MIYQLARILLFSIIIGTSIVSAQDDVRTPTGRREITPEQIKNRDFDRRRKEMDRVSNLPRENPNRKKRKTMSKAERRRFKQATTPLREDVEKYRTFLKSKNTGIFRMLPNFDCESERLIKVDGKCANFVPGTWSYSFRQGDFSNRDFHDVGVIGDVFVSRSLLNQGILVSLGDLAIQDTVVSSPGMSFLAEFSPAIDREGARRQLAEIGGGIEQDGYLYANQAKLVSSRTYGIRVVAYRMNDRWSSRLWPKNENQITKDELKFRGLEFDKRIDALFVFRVIRIDENGGITIVWKRLEKTKSPKLVFEENEKLEDFGSIRG